MRRWQPATTPTPGPARSASCSPEDMAMRVGISGKGGVGKTTISAVLSRTLARRGHRVIAIDCDSDPNLAANVGLDEEVVGMLRPLLDQSGAVRYVPRNLSPATL